MQLKLYVEFKFWAYENTSPDRGQGSRASRWPERVKVDLPADTSQGVPKPLCSKGAVNHNHVFTIRQSLLAPGIQLAIPIQPLYPQPEPDKGLFT